MNARSFSPGSSAAVTIRTVGHASRTWFTPSGAEITDTAIKLHLRPWTTTEHFAQVAADTMEAIKTTMESSGLKFSVALQTPA